MLVHSNFETNEAKRNLPSANLLCYALVKQRQQNNMSVLRHHSRLFIIVKCSLLIYITENQVQIYPQVYYEINYYRPYYNINYLVIFKLV